jgi:hypothetical protein
MATAALGERLIARPAPPPSHLRGFIEGLGRRTRISVIAVFTGSLALMLTDGGLYTGTDSLVRAR